MATTEKRFPRATFTKKLSRMCERLDASSTHTLSFEHWFFDRRESATSTVTALWVVGSYARGALECGDLDVVVEVSTVGGEPPQRQLMRTFFGAPPYVRCYAGTPDKNTSGIAFPNPVCIWTGPGCDWLGALQGIAPDPSAGRAKRAIDAIPFRPEQLRAHIEQLEELLKLRRKGLLEWNFVAFDQKLLAPIAASDFLESEEYVERFIRLEFAGQGVVRLLHPVSKVMRKIEPGGAWSSDSGRRTDIWCGGTLVYFGRPFPHIHRFDGDAKLRQIGLAPHISARGPNGLWLIRRGRNHEDILTFAEIRSFYLVEAGKPCITTWLDFTEGRHHEGEVLELFRTQKKASQGAKEWQEVAELDERVDPPEVAEVRGSDLLSLTALCDVVQVDGAGLAITHIGRLLTGQSEISTIADIAALLSNSHG